VVVTLRDLDARLVPRLASALRALLDGTAHAARESVATVRRPASSLVAAARIAPLQRLDDRYASTGPLKLLRDVPQLGVLVIAAVFLAGTGAALALTGPDSAERRSPAQREAALPLTLGASAGTDIDAHFAAARERVRDLAEREPDARHLALLTLNKSLTAEQAALLLDETGLSVRRAYLRAPGVPDAETIPFQTPGDFAAGLRQVLARIAAGKAEEQRALLETARTVEPTTAEEEAFRAQFEADARSVGQEAAVYQEGCACVFALVVQASAAELAALPRLSVVRGVEAAPRGVQLDVLDIRPLPPEVQGVVPAGTSRDGSGRP
jgi:hypothetical protein